jgi:alkylated DNA repair dioxygenase AlkB
MNLFPYETTRNLLPFDGIAHYYGPILTSREAQDYLQSLLATVPWKNDEAVICGKRIVTARKVAWYGDSSYSYTYSGTTKIALPWTKELRILKSLVEEKVGCFFNSCLCNLYHHGNEGMGWHSDDEKMLGKNTAIGSLSLGAERKFSLRHKHKGDSPSISIHLENGSLLVMKGTTQTFWQHSLPKTAKIDKPRINLTFRTIVLEEVSPLSQEKVRFDAANHADKGFPMFPTELC